MRFRPFPLFLAAALLSGCLASHAPRFRLPPAGRWHASSENEDPAHPAAAALDGDPATFFRPDTTRPSSLVVDLSANTFLSGFLIDWGEVPPASFRLLASQDALSWHTVYHADRPDSSQEFGFFDAILARYVRLSLESAPSAAATVRSFVLFGANERPEVSVSDGPAPSAFTLFDGNDETFWHCREKAATLSIDFRRAFSPGGITLFWGPAGPPGRIRLSGSEDGKSWTPLGETDTQGDESDTVLFDSMPLRYLRIAFRDVETTGSFDLSGIRLRGAKGESAGWTAYAFAAEKAPALYPAALSGRQPYRTMSLSSGNAARGAYLGSDGSFAATMRLPALQPLLETGGELLGADHASETVQALEGEGSPLASVRWRFTNGLAVTFRALAPHGGIECPLWEADVENTSDRTVSGSLWLLLRPISLAPPWERGGFSPIRSLSFVSSPGGWQTALVNGRARFAVAATAREAKGRVAEFDGGDVVRRLSAPRAETEGEDPKQGLLSGAWKRPFRLAPGKHARTVVATTARRSGAKDAPWPPLKNPADAAALFERGWESEAAAWKERLGHPDIEAPGDEETFEAFRTAHARLLAGPPLREWNLDEAASRISALLRLGETAKAKEIAEATFAAFPPEGPLPSRVATLRGPLSGERDEEKSYDEGKSALPAVWTLFTALEIYRYDHDRTWLLKRADVLERAVAELERTTPGTDDPSPPGWWKRHLHLARPPAPAAPYLEQLAAAAGWRQAASLALVTGDVDAAGQAETRAQELFEALRGRLRRQLDVLPLASPFPTARADGKFSAETFAYLYFPARATGELPQDLRTRSLQEILRALLARRRTRSAWEKGARVSFALAAAAEGERDLARELLHDMVAGAYPRGWHAWAENYSRNDPSAPRRAGAMPSWMAISEFVRTVAGLVAEEENGAVWILRGAPAEWLLGGIEAEGLATPYGKVDVRARWEGKKFSVELEADGTPPSGWRIAWPAGGVAPTRVLSAGRPVRGWDATGIRLDGAFRGKIDAYFPCDPAWLRTPD